MTSALELDNQRRETFLKQYKERLESQRTVGENLSTPSRSPPTNSHQEIDLATTLAAIATILQRYVRFESVDQIAAVTLWIAHTHVFDAFQYTPYLFVSSAEKQSGKTRLLEVLALLVRNPWAVVMPSEAVVYRKIEKDPPTILLDEIDAVYPKGGSRGGRDYEGLRAILNSGYQRGARVPRCGGANWDQLQEFEVYCPKAFAGIGQCLPETVVSRAIPIRLKRQARGEKAQRFRERYACRVTEPLRAELEEWAAVVDLEDLGAAEPALPEQLGDRSADIWEPLLTVADRAGGSWPTHARAAALALHADAEATEESIGVQLLRDLRRIFSSRGGDRIQSELLERELGLMEGRPWAEFREGRSITRVQIARLLQPYDVAPKSIRFGEGTCKGYYLSQFQDAFKRYLPAEAVAVRPEQPEHRNGSNSCGADTERVPVRGGPKSLSSNSCSGVPAQAGIRETPRARSSPRLHDDCRVPAHDPEGRAA